MTRRLVWLGLFAYVLAVFCGGVALVARDWLTVAVLLSLFVLALIIGGHFVIVSPWFADPARHERGEVGPPTPTSPPSFSYNNVVSRALCYGPTDEQRMIVRGLTDRLGVGPSPDPETTPDETLP